MTDTPKGMNQQETFGWLVERSNRLDATEAKLFKTQLALARLRVKPLVDEALKADVQRFEPHRRRW